MTNEATIATSFAREFAPLLGTSFWEVVVSVATALAAIFAAASACLSGKSVKIQEKIQKTQLIADINNRFFEITTSFPLGTSGHPIKRDHIQLLGNFFEYVSWLVVKKRIDLVDIELLHVEMKRQWKDFAIDYRIKYGEDYYTYWKIVVEMLTQ
jgi:hypothetical protein